MASIKHRFVISGAWPQGRAARDHPVRLATTLGSKRSLPLSVATLSGLACLPFAFVPGVHWDDAYITFRFADNLASGHGFVFNPGEPSNGFTSALWTLALAAVALIAGPQSLPAAAQALGVICHAATAGVTAGLVLDRLGRPWIAALAGLAIGANPLLVLLAVSGMETPLALFLLACALWLYARDGLGRSFRLGVVLGLAFLARPESALLAVVIFAVEGGRAAGAWRRRSAGLRNLVFCGVATLVVAGPWMVGSWWRSGDLLPPTREGKLTGRLPERHGITYPELAALSASDRARLAAADLRGLFAPSEGGTLALPAVLGIAAVALSSLHPAVRARLRPHGPLLLVAGSFTAVLLGALAFFFPLPMPRYATPLLPAATAATFVGIGSLLPPAEKAGRAALLLAASTAAGALLLAYRAFVPHAAAERVRGEIGRWLAASVPRDSVIALEPIGQIGFTSGLRIIDLGGLVSPGVWPYIARGFRSDLEGLRGFLDRQGVTHMVDYASPSPFSLAPLTEGPGFLLLRTFDGGQDRYLVFERLPAAPSSGRQAEKRFRSGDHVEAVDVVRRPHPELVGHGEAAEHTGEVAHEDVRGGGPSQGRRARGEGEQDEVRPRIPDADDVPVPHHESVDIVASHQAERRRAGEDARGTADGRVEDVGRRAGSQGGAGRVQAEVGVDVMELVARGVQEVQLDSVDVVLDARRRCDGGRDGEDQVEVGLIPMRGLRRRDGDAGAGGHGPRRAIDRKRGPPQVGGRLVPPRLDTIGRPRLPQAGAVARENQVIDQSRRGPGVGRDGIDVVGGRQTVGVRPDLHLRARSADVTAAARRHLQVDVGRRDHEGADCNRRRVAVDRHTRVRGQGGGGQESGGTQGLGPDIQALLHEIPLQSRSAAFVRCRPLTGRIVPAWA